MRTVIENTYEEISRKLADFIISKVKEKPNSVLCFAGGHTPLKTYQYLIEANKEGSVDFKQAEFLLLDEWVGIGRETFGSCIQTLNDELFNHLDITYDKQVHYFDGTSSNIENEVVRMNDLINDLGGIDISLLGIGMNGHLGFNEPGINEFLDVALVPLDPVTAEVGKKYFKTNVDTQFGITIGLKKLMESKYLILMANGAKKADIVYETLNGPITNQVPSSIARKHGNAFLYLDKDAASKLGR